MHLILTGATGLVGSSVLSAMLHAKDVSKITILTRSPVRMATDSSDPRVHIIHHPDFQTYPTSLLDQLRDADGCVWALGISQTKVSAEEYVKITKDYTLAAARSFATLSPSKKRPFRFIYVSGEGATQSPGRFSQIFARVKGETELALADLSAEEAGLRADSVRPAFVDAAKHEAIREYIPDPGLLYKVTMAALGPAVRMGYRSWHSPTEVLGEFMTRMAVGELDGRLEGAGAFRLGGGESWVVENSGFRRIMGLS